MPQSFPAHVFVPSLNPAPAKYDVVSMSQSAGGALFLQVFTGYGYQWLAPSEYQLVCPAPYCVFADGHDGPHDVIFGRYAA